MMSRAKIVLPLKVECRRRYRAGSPLSRKSSPNKVCFGISKLIWTFPEITERQSPQRWIIYSDSWCLSEFYHGTLSLVSTHLTNYFTGQCKTVRIEDETSQNHQQWQIQAETLHWCLDYRDLILILQASSLLPCHYVTNLGISERAKWLRGFRCGLFPSPSAVLLIQIHLRLTAAPKILKHGWLCVFFPQTPPVFSAG